MMRSLVLSTLLVLSPVLACSGQRPGNPILDLARTWSGAGAALKCERPSPDAQDVDDQVDPRHCEWERATPGTPFERIRAGVDLGGGPSLLSWERYARDSADAARVIDSLDVALGKRGLRRHECGTSSRPGGGRIQEILWEKSDLLLFLMLASIPDSAPLLMVAASDDPATMPRFTLCHLETAPDAMWPPERGPLPRALRSAMVLGVVDFQLARDSVLAVIHYRTNAPARDSASVRMTLTERLARPNSMFGALHSGDIPRQTTRLIIRPCHADSCPPLGKGLPLVPGDLEFMLRPDSAWVPAERPGTRRPRIPEP
jgi:hypothetical protein